MASGGSVSITVIVDFPLSCVTAADVGREEVVRRPTRFLSFASSLRLEQIASALGCRPPRIFCSDRPRDLVIVESVFRLGRRLDAGNVERTHHLPVGPNAHV